MLLAKLFIHFFIVGCFSFGGGYAMLPLINQIVISNEWMSAYELTDIISLSGMLPGSIGINAASFVGYKQAGVLGVIVATLGMVSPSIIIVYLVSKYMNKFKDNIYIKKILYGLKPVVVGLIFYAALNLLLSMEAVTNVSLNSFIYMMVILLFLVLLMYRKVNPLLLIIVSGVYGVIFNI